MLAILQHVGLSFNSSLYFLSWTCEFSFYCWCSTKCLFLLLSYISLWHLLSLSHTLFFVSVSMILCCFIFQWFVLLPAFSSLILLGRVSPGSSPSLAVVPLLFPSLGFHICVCLPVRITTTPKSIFSLGLLKGPPSSSFPDLCPLPFPFFSSSHFLSPPLSLFPYLPFHILSLTHLLRQLLLFLSPASSVWVNH